MVIDMNEQQLTTVAQLRAFLSGTQEVSFEPRGDDAQRYAFITQVVRRLQYRRLKRTDNSFARATRGRPTPRELRRVR